MCNEACIDFAKRVIGPSDVSRREVLEVGSLDTTGSIRPFVEAMGPASYVGVDIASGPRVDLICDVGELTDRFGLNSFDVVVATELVEHVRDWRLAWTNMKSVLRSGGLLLVTTRSFGFPFHFGPFDFWRYEAEDMRRIVDEMDLVSLEPDPISPGIFVAARKSASHAADLSSIRLYSIIQERRVLDVSAWDIARYRLTHPSALARRVLPQPLRRLLRRVVPGARQ